MGRYLLAIIAVWAIYILIRSAQKRRNIRMKTDTRKPVEDMVECAYCHTHLPKSEALSSGGSYYCSDEHLSLGDRNPPSD